MIGALVYEDYFLLKKQNKITGFLDANLQIQPSSVDLSLSNECFQIKASFLSPKNKVRDKLKKISFKKIDIKKPQIFKKIKLI